MKEININTTIGTVNKIHHNLGNGLTLVKGEFCVLANDITTEPTRLYGTKIGIPFNESDIISKTPVLIKANEERFQCVELVSGEKLPILLKFNELKKAQMEINGKGNYFCDGKYNYFVISEFERPSDIEKNLYLYTTSEEDIMNLIANAKNKNNQKKPFSFSFMKRK